MLHDSRIGLRNTAIKVDLPLVTVALPVYNGSATLEMAIRSILMQTLQNWELIIVDDGSTDNSLEVVREFNDPRIRIVEHKMNKNLPASLNEAVGLASGHYLARMDQDDIAYPERLAVQVAYMEAHPEIDLIGSGVAVFANNGSCQGRLPMYESHADICCRPCNGFYLPHPTWLGKTDWFRKNPYRIEAAKAEDQDLLLRSYVHSHFACLPEILLGYRQENRTFRKLFAARKAFAASCLREALQRLQLHLLPILSTYLILKVVADFLNIYLGVRRFRHRLEKLSPDALSRWQKVWHDVSTYNADIVRGA